MTTLTTASKKERPFFKLSIVFVVLFLDFLLFAAVIPFIPLLILEPKSSILTYSLPLETRCIILGALYSVYPLAQMLFSPLLGAFSDKFGRKTMLLTAYLGNGAGYFLFAAGIYTNQVALLFLGFFIAGSTGCNISTTNTIISDLSKSEEKLRRYSFSNMVVGLAFVLGPLCAGRATEVIPKVQTLAFLTFLACGFIALCNAAIIARYFKHANVQEDTPKPHPLGIKTILSQDRRLILAFSATFLLFFGWYSFIKFFQALFLNNPNFCNLEIFNALSYFGICCVISQLLFSLFLHKIFKERQHLFFFIALLACSILATTVVKSYAALMITVTLFSFAYSILCPCIMFEISEFGTIKTRGKIMGVYQSVQDLAKILAPTIAGCMMAIWANGPAIIACSFILCSLVVFYVGSRKNCTEQGSNL